MRGLRSSRRSTLWLFGSLACVVFHRDELCVVLTQRLLPLGALALLTFSPQAILLVLRHHALHRFKKVRRAGLQFDHKGPSHVPDIERAAAVGDLRVEENLQQHVCQLLAKLLLHPLRSIGIRELFHRADNFCQLFGFLAQVRQEALMSHLLLPLALAQSARHECHGIFDFVHHGRRNLGARGAAQACHGNGVLVGTDNLPVHNLPAGDLYLLRVGEISLDGAFAGHSGLPGRFAALQLTLRFHLHQQRWSADEVIPTLQLGLHLGVLQIRCHQHIGRIHRVSTEVSDDPPDAHGDFLRVRDITGKQGDGLHGDHRGETGIEQNHRHETTFYPLNP